MADQRRLAPHDIEILLRSLAMAPLSNETVRRALLAHRDLLAERARLESLLSQLSPPWSEVRAVLNQLHRLLTDAPDTATGHGPGG